MKMKVKSEFVNDDWERIYFDDEVVFQNHSVTARQLMDFLSEYGVVDIEFTQVEEDC